MKIQRYLHLHIKIICERFCIVIPLTFRDIPIFMKCLFVNIQKQLAYFLRKIQILRVNNCRILRFNYAKFSGHCFCMNLSIMKFSNLQQCTFKYTKSCLTQLGNNLNLIKHCHLLFYTLRYNKQLPSTYQENFGKKIAPQVSLKIVY